MRERNRRYQKEERYERDLREILDLLDEPVDGVNLGNVLPASMKTGGFLGSGLVSAGSKRALWT